MKVEYAETKGVKPIQILLETQDEIDRLWTILNFRPIHRGMHLNNTWQNLYNLLSKQRSDAVKEMHLDLRDTIVAHCRKDLYLK